MKTPHIPVRSPDFTIACSKNSCKAPGKNDTPFISKMRRTWHDGDIREISKPIRVKSSFTPIVREVKEVKGKMQADGSFQMPVRVNGKFGSPIIFSASLMAKLT